MSRFPRCIRILVDQTHSEAKANIIVIGLKFVSSLETVPGQGKIPFLKRFQPLLADGIEFCIRMTLASYQKQAKREQKGNDSGPILEINGQDLLMLKIQFLKKNLSVVMF